MFDFLFVIAHGALIGVKAVEGGAGFCRRAPLCAATSSLKLHGEHFRVPSAIGIAGYERIRQAGGVMSSEV